MNLKKFLTEEERIDEDYTTMELNRINPTAETINVKVSDYDGNSTKFLGMNDMKALMAMKKFIEKRMKAIK